QSIEKLSGALHRVVTCLVLLESGQSPVVAYAQTDVRFRELTPDEQHWYIATGDGRDKAGAYGIQSLGGALIREIHGDWFNVVGLPMPLLIDLLKQYFPEYWPPKITDSCATYE
nr:Maf family protein [bacterium]